MTQRLLVYPPSPVAPAHEDMLADAWLYALGQSDNARRKLTNADYEQQPNEGPMWERLPLMRLANWYIREGNSDSSFVRALRHEKYLTGPQVRGVVNVMLGAHKRGWRPPWAARL